MVELTFNVLGFSFQQGLKHLRASFEAGAIAIAREREGAYDAVKAYLASVAAGGLQIGEWNEDGTRVWDQEQVLEFDAESMNLAARAHRHAFVVAIYHHWERAAWVWAGRPAKVDHARLARWTRDRGYPVDDRLEPVRHLTNLLKHDNPRWAGMVFKVWPEVLPWYPLDHRPRSFAEEVFLTDDHVREVLEIVAASGPTSDMLPVGRT